MTDIVARLRDLVSERKSRGSGAITTIDPNITGWLAEAADEIVRLRKVPNNNRDWVRSLSNEGNELRAEIERLRAALLKIEGYLERWADEPECGEFYELARRALEHKP